MWLLAIINFETETADESSHTWVRMGQLHFMCSCKKYFKIPFDCGFLCFFLTISLSKQIITETRVNNGNAAQIYTLRDISGLIFDSTGGNLGRHRKFESTHSQIHMHMPPHTTLQQLVWLLCPRKPQPAVKLNKTFPIIADFASCLNAYISIKFDALIYKAPKRHPATHTHTNAPFFCWSLIISLVTRLLIYFIWFAANYFLVFCISTGAFVRFDNFTNFDMIMNNLLWWNQP